MNQFYSLEEFSKILTHGLTNNAHGPITFNQVVKEILTQVAHLEISLFITGFPSCSGFQYANLYIFFSFLASSYFIFK